MSFRPARLTHGPAIRVEYQAFFAVLKARKCAQPRPLNDCVWCDCMCYVNACRVPGWEAR